MADDTELLPRDQRLHKAYREDIGNPANEASNASNENILHNLKKELRNVVKILWDQMFKQPTNTFASSEGKKTNDHLP